MKKITLKNSVLKIMATLMLMIFCGIFLVGCVGAGVGGGSGGSGTGGSGSSSGSGSGSSSEKPKNPYEGEADKSIQDFNDVFMGAIGVYDVDSNAEVFYDNYLNTNVNFNTLINRQFATLATVIYDSLNYVYGESGSFSGGTLSGYGASAISFSGIKDSLVGATIYRGIVNNSLSPASIEPKYTNAMNGTYKIIRLEEDSDRPILDAENNQVEIDGVPQWEKDVFFNYDTNLTSRPWAKPLTSASDLVAPLMNLYKTGVNQADIKTIGFTESYKDSVINYINNTVIGSSLISESNSAKGSVFNGSSLKFVDDSNYQTFENYKAYEIIVPNIVNNAFKLVKEGSSAKISSNYCYSGIDWDKTLFPNLGRYEYIFYDDVDDISDAECEEYPDDFDVENMEPDEDFEHETDPDYDFEEDGAPDDSAQYKIGSKRKLKEIILLPKVDKTKVGGDTFNFMRLMIAFARPSGTSESRVLISTSVIDNTGKSHENKPVILDDGTYSVVLPGQDEPMTGGERVDFVTDDGKIIIDEEASGNTAEGEANKLSIDIFSSTKEMESFNFGDLPISETDIKKSFKESKYTVVTTGEEISAWKLNVWNNLVLLDFTDIYSINFSKNIIRFKFDYFNSSNNPIAIPELYLMEFFFLE